MILQTAAYYLSYDVVFLNEGSVTTNKRTQSSKEYIITTPSVTTTTPFRIGLVLKRSITTVLVFVREDERHGSMTLVFFNESVSQMIKSLPKYRLNILQIVAFWS